MLLVIIFLILNLRLLGRTVQFGFTSSKQIFFVQVDRLGNAQDAIRDAFDRVKDL